MSMPMIEPACSVIFSLESFRWSISKGYLTGSRMILPLRMAYVHKNQEALLIVGQESVCFMLLTKTAAGSDLLEKVQEQTGLAFHVGF